MIRIRSFQEFLYHRDIILQTKISKWYKSDGAWSSTRHCSVTHSMQYLSKRSVFRSTLWRNYCLPSWHGYLLRTRQVGLLNHVVEADLKNMKKWFDEKFLNVKTNEIFFLPICSNINQFIRLDTLHLECTQEQDRSKELIMGFLIIHI